VISPESVGPLSRPVLIARLPPEGLKVEVEATPEECAALAGDFKLDALKSLRGSFRLTGTGRHVHVVGRVMADLVQTCVVTLEPFESHLDEEVEVDFAEPDPLQRKADPEPEVEIDLAHEGPDEIVDGRIDLGALAAEFLAIGLDPYPRKPGVDFQFDAGDGEESPFAKLAALKRGES
jgi:hypothetical protein